MTDRNLQFGHKANRHKLRASMVRTQNYRRPGRTQGLLGQNVDRVILGRADICSMDIPTMIVCKDSRHLVLGAERGRLGVES